MTKIAVLGAGSWGTALANTMAINDVDVQIWSHRADQVEEINQQHTNEKYLPGAQLSPKLQAEADMTTAVKGADLVLVVVPTKAIRTVGEQLAAVLTSLNQQVILAHATKGLEQGLTYGFLKCSEKWCRPSVTQL